MILIADSGSTKTHWRLLAPCLPVKEFASIGLNPYYVNSSEIEEYVRKTFFFMGEYDKIGYVYFYGSGCSHPDSCQVVKKGLENVFCRAQIYIESDLTGAARALFNDQEGIVLVLGTGASSCLYDGNRISGKLPSLGYIMGDEGSGAYFGLNLLKAYFYNELPAELVEKMKQKYNMELDNVLRLLYREKFPNRYLAEFAVFLHENRQHPFINRFLKKGFNEFFNKMVLKYNHFHEKKIGIVGSIAFYFSDIIKETALANKLRIDRIIQDPMNGLIKYHQRQIN